MLDPVTASLATEKQLADALMKINLAMNNTRCQHALDQLQFEQASILQNLQERSMKSQHGAGGSISLTRDALSDQEQTKSKQHEESHRQQKISRAWSGAANPAGSA